ncbi:protein kinase C eta type-like isoform X2 [Pomacea canaliculata]|uniref:protein kinase C eta type-like isoform X2 n=1 Tax=Pomacea canaliculata TaxID=400727 RepID=UPI000D738D7E|nr:protein kinase C eta type-like isoform X2 [Pomacea canaliculata]
MEESNKVLAVKNDPSNDAQSGTPIDEPKTECPYPRVTQSKNDSTVDVSSSLYGQSQSSHELVRYVVSDMLGKGHYGSVFLAVHEATSARFALKILRKNFRNVQKYAYVEEGVLRIGRNCPFIIRLFNSFQTDNAYYLVMEYASGGNLKEVLEKYGLLSVDVARYLAAEMVLALQFLHENGVIHRDLKIQNVLLSSQNHVRLIDFGLSKLGIYSGDVTGSGCGTPFYMAPEILRRIPYSHQVDWWAMGVLLYKIITGSFPFMGKTNPEVFVAVTHDNVYYDSWLPSDLVLFLKGLLTKNPAKRLGKTELAGKDIRSHSFFRLIDWGLVSSQKYELPLLDLSLDTTSAIPSGSKPKSKQHVSRRLSVSEDVVTKENKHSERLPPVTTSANRSWCPPTVRPDAQTLSTPLGLYSIEPGKSCLSDNESVTREREEGLNAKYPYLTSENQVGQDDNGKLSEFTLAQKRAGGNTDPGS